MAYKPFLISNMRQGQILGIKPWLLPEDAFELVENASLRRGVLEKRRGKTEFAATTLDDDGAAIFEDDCADDDTGDYTEQANATLVHNGSIYRYGTSNTTNTLVFKTVAVTTVVDTLYRYSTTISDGDVNTKSFRLRAGTAAAGAQLGESVVFTTDGVPTEVELVFRATTTTSFLTFTSNDTNYGGYITLDSIDFFAVASGSGNPIVGIFPFIESTGVETLMVTDTKRLFEYNASTTVLDDKDGANYWTGDQSNFISSDNYEGIVYMTNNKDQMRKYNGTAVSVFVVDIDGGGNDLNFCLHVVVNKERLILFRTSESGVLYPQRVRWSAIGDAATWTGDEFVDAPTSEWIRGVKRLKDDIVVFFDRSIWMLKYTGNNTLPFRWERISDIGGSIAEFGTVVRGDKSFSIAKTNVIGADEFSAAKVDQKNPDAIFDIDGDNAGLVFGGRFDELQQFWWLYPVDGSSSQDRVLAINYDDWSWSVYKITLTCLGFYQAQDSDTWASITGTWAEAEGAWVGGATQAGFPLAIGGDEDGKIHVLNNGTDDDGAAIAMNVKSGRWNPFSKAGLAARMGYIDFLIESDAVTELSVDFFIDFDDVAYQTKTLSFDQTGEKAWVRLYSGAIGTTHQIRLYDSETDQQPKIHAIMPYFEPVRGGINIG